MAHVAFVPHLASREIEGVEHWYVRMETKTGSFDILSETRILKTWATRDLRRIRQEMAELWLAKYWA
jgi:hypothetical protein